MLTIETVKGFIEAVKLRALIGSKNWMQSEAFRFLKMVKESLSEVPLHPCQP